VTPEESLERIKLRSRDCESTISIEYLRALHAAYEEFIQEIGRVIPVLRIKYSEFKTAEEMANIIEQEFHSMLNIRNIQ
jgi:deoxyadenosine kinase